MKRFYVQTIVAAGVAVMGLTLGAAAQTSPALLNSIEVQRLVASRDPTAHARLRDHFTALAATYDAQARQHSAMAQGFAGNSTHPTLGMGEHCKRLADIATQEATTVKEIATYHGQLAAGAAETVPRNAAPYEGGKGAPAPTEKQLHDLAAGAGTPADRRSLAEYYLNVARAQEAAATEHAAMAQTYRASSNRQGAASDPAIHCDRMVMLSRAAAKEARAAEAQQRQLANVG
jgi:hypothetical protein